MSAAPLEVDETLSWARRTGGRVSFHLRLPGSSLLPGPTVVELVGPSGRLRTTAEVTATEGAVEVAAEVPHRELGMTAWRVTIQSPAGGRFVPVQARVLAVPGSPVALLPGPAPSTRMRPPTAGPRRSLARRVASRLPAPLRRVLRRGRSGGRAVVGRLR